MTKRPLRCSGPGYRTPTGTCSRIRRLIPRILLPIAATGIGCSGEIDRSDEFGLGEGGGRIEVIVLDSSAYERGATPKAGAAAGEDSQKPFSGSTGFAGAPTGSAGSPGPSESPGPTTGSPGTDAREGLLAGAVAYEPDGEFTVQVGVYSDAPKAREQVAELSALGYPAYGIAQPDGKGVRVRIGYFRTREDARAFGNIFSEDHGADFWIDRRVNEF